MVIRAENDPVNVILLWHYYMGEFEVLAANLRH